MSNNDQKEETSASIKPLFEDVSDDFAEGFKDRARALHEHFDKDQDGFLSFSELAALQRATDDGVRLSEDNYELACKCLHCDPRQGIPLEALKLTYMAEGSSLGKQVTATVKSDARLLIAKADILRLFSHSPFLHFYNKYS
jgi:hypothetical protein